MSSLIPSRLARWGRTALGVLALTVMFGPSLAAFATSRPVVPVPTKPLVPVIGAHPFLSLASDTCLDDGPLHIGPVERTKGLIYEAGLVERMTRTARQCLSSSGYLTLSASVDGKGKIADISADSGVDPAPAVCARSAILAGGAVETRGPGQMTIGFFIGTRP
jgi:hypothetical protein